MSLLPSVSASKKALHAHGWLGLLTGAALYFICLSGALAVFLPQFERWEQPDIPEYLSYSADNIEKAYLTALSKPEQLGHDMVIRLPTSDKPRATMYLQDGTHYINQDGSVSSLANHPFSELLVNLHLYLHLPKSFGMILVSICGAIMCGLIISGFVAHRRIRKDAFALRLNSSQRTADIHNRLSVWGTPFYLVIAVTGAFFGLAAWFNWILAETLYDGDRSAVVEEVYASAPLLEGIGEPVAISKILEAMPAIAPKATPFYITIEDINTPKQYVIVGASHENRLIYAEQYRFAPDGSYLDKAGFSDGEPGRQVIFSTYQIHFGWFDGLAIQFIYLGFGLALTVISASGINIWLNKRKYRDVINPAWEGILWGAPLAIASCAFTQIAFNWISVAECWLIILAATVCAIAINNDSKIKSIFCFTTGLVLVATSIAHVAHFGADAIRGVSLGVNIAGLAAAAFMGWLGWRSSNDIIKATPVALK